jgi:hypothetical protein
VSAAFLGQWRRRGGIEFDMRDLRHSLAEITAIGQAKASALAGGGQANVVESRRKRP